MNTYGLGTDFSSRPKTQRRSRHVFLVLSSPQRFQSVGYIPIPWAQATIIPITRSKKSYCKKFIYSIIFKGKLWNCTFQKFKIVNMRKMRTYKMVLYYKLFFAFSAKKHYNSLPKCTKCMYCSLLGWHFCHSYLECSVM